MSGFLLIGFSAIMLCALPILDKIDRWWIYTRHGVKDPFA